MNWSKTGASALLMAGVFAVSSTMMSTTASAETVWKLALKDSLESVEGEIVQKFADLVSRYTKGNVKVEIYPSEQLGAAQATLELLSAGAIAIYAEESSYLEKWSPEITWTSAPFLFETRDHYIRFLQSDYVGGLVQKATDVANVAVLEPRGAVLRGPYRVILTTTPVNTFEDIAGKRLRMWDQQLIVDIWSHLGAEVRVLAWSDIYQSVQTGIVEGLTAPVAAVEGMKFTEVAPYIARTDEFYQSVDFMINSDALAALTDDERAAVQRAYEETATFSHELTNSGTGASIDRLVKAGATYVELDTAPFVERMKSFYEESAASGALPPKFLAAVEASR